MKAETRVGVFVIGAAVVLLYLSFNIGAFRMDHKSYDTYISYFDDTGGLNVKAPVKTSGVEIGRVDAIHLREGGKAEVHLKILKAYKLALNAYAMIQQETLLGQKVIELDQGDFSTGTLVPGSTLAMPGKSSVNVGDLIDQARDIAQNISDIALSFKNVFATRDGKRRMESTLKHAAQAAEDIASSADVLDRTLRKNEKNIDAALENTSIVSGDLRREVPKVTRSIRGAVGDLRRDVLPAISKAGGAFDALEDTAIQAREGFREAEEVMEKINKGKGLVGKLINEEETYADLKKTVRGLKEYVDRMQSLQVYIDMHSENLFKYTENKGYLDIKIRPSHDYFYQIQLASDEFGTLERTVKDTKWYNADGDELSTKTLLTGASGHDKLKFASRKEVVKRKKDQLQFGFQFGKRFNRLAFRIGMFENTIGAACDFYIPLNTDLMHWISSIECFDMRGRKRLDDSRPHVKWLNKLYFMKNFYTAFGIDDIVSRGSASPFFGAGLRFTDSDLKYFLGMFGGMAKR
ncbi:MAG: MlaD family protein [Candidatus Dependentiae bacterium]